MFIFLQHRQFRNPEQNNPVLVEKLFRLLARVHALEVPIEKMKRNWYFEYLDDYYSRYLTKDEENKKLIEELGLNNISNADIRAEIEWVKQIVTKSNSPVLFTHMDFKGQNILVTEPDDNLILCDFEVEMRLVWNHQKLQSNFGVI